MHSVDVKREDYLEDHSPAVSSGSFCRCCMFHKAESFRWTRELDEGHLSQLTISESTGVFQVTVVLAVASVGRADANN